MKSKNLIKALEKAGIKVEMTTRKIYDHFEKKWDESRAEYWAENGKNKIHWYDQEGEAICCQVMSVKENNDSQRDYFPGFFARTIKIAIQGMGF